MRDVRIKGKPDYQQDGVVFDARQGDDAILDIKAVAGGTEASAWVGMLARMYCKWAKRKGFSTEELSLSANDNGGIRSIVLLLSGKNVFPLIRNESGIHRLSRVSPFDANARRQTSFASVTVHQHNFGEVFSGVSMKDIRVDTFRASGSGGQHINKTDSAVRMTHVPSGTTVQCQDDRSQRRNKEAAFKILQGRLKSRSDDKVRRRKAKDRQEKAGASWGSQIRTYVLHPSQRVKDHRTGKSVGDAHRVLDGNIDAFLI